MCGRPRSWTSTTSGSVPEETSTSSRRWRGPAAPDAGILCSNAPPTERFISFDPRPRGRASAAESRWASAATCPAARCRPSSRSPRPRTARPAGARRWRGLSPDRTTLCSLRQATRQRRCALRASELSPNGPGRPAGKTGGRPKVGSDRDSRSTGKLGRKRPPLGQRSPMHPDRHEAAARESAAARPGDAVSARCLRRDHLVHGELLDVRWPLRLDSRRRHSFNDPRGEGVEVTA